MDKFLANAVRISLHLSFCLRDSVANQTVFENKANFRAELTLTL